MTANPNRPEGPERRRSPRKRVLREALVVRRNLNTTMKCAVMDLSEHGARLLPEDSMTVPELFELRIRNGDTRLARVVRTRGRYVHIEFV